VTSHADHLLARDLAAAAGERLLKLRAAHASAHAADGAAGADASDAADKLRKAGDLGAQDFLAERLAAARPDDAILSEEAADDKRRLAADRVWIIDPLDGTREFGEPGRTDWAVHVALWERGSLTAGAVALPAQGMVLCTADPPALHEPAERIRLVVSRSRPPQFVTLVAEAIDAELVPLGSAGAKAAAVINGQVDAYVHAGGQYEWDSAAPVAVARSAGLHATRIDGSELKYNQEHPYLPDLLICHESLAGPLIDAIGKIRAGGS